MAGYKIVIKHVLHISLDIPIAGQKQNVQHEKQRHLFLPEIRIHGAACIMLSGTTPDMLWLLAGKRV